MEQQYTRIAYVLGFQTYCQLIDILSVNEKLPVSKFPYIEKYFSQFLRI